MNRKERKLNLKKLKELLHYNYKTGTWIRMAARKGYLIGSEAGKLRPSGYIEVGVEMERYQSHRLAWFYMTGKWPQEQIDHINGIRSDNKWENLREATNSQNQLNRKNQKPNKNGFNGVLKTEDHWRRKPFSSKIMIDGKSIYLGRYATAHEAHAAYVSAAKRLHKHYSRFR